MPSLIDDATPSRAATREDACRARLGVGVIAALACLGFAPTAAADSRVVFVGLDGPTGLVDLTTLDAALLEQGRLEEHMHVAGGTEQAARLRGEFHCASFDESCLERVAEGRHVDRVIYGDVTTIEGDDDHYQVTLHVYDLYTRTTRDHLSGTIDIDRVAAEHATNGLAEKLVDLVVRIPEEGTATVRALPGSTVLLDDRTIDTVPASGQLVLRPIRVGRRELRVIRPNHSTWEAPIVVRARESIQVTVDAGASVASFDEAAARAHESSQARPTGRASAIHPPPDYILTIPGVTATADASADLMHEGDGLAHVGGFHIPIIEEHVAGGGEIRTTTHARVGFLPNVSSSGARVTAKLHF